MHTHTHTHTQVDRWIDGSKGTTMSTRVSIVHRERRIYKRARARHTRNVPSVASPFTNDNMSEKPVTPATEKASDVAASADGSPKRPTKNTGCMYVTSNHDIRIDTPPHFSPCQYMYIYASFLQVPCTSHPSYSYIDSSC